MATNFRDPRFQRSMLKAGSLRGGQAQRRAAEDITGRFAASQQEKDLRNEAIFEKRRQFEDNMRLREKGLALDTKKLGLAERKLSRQQYERQKLRDFDYKELERSGRLHEKGLRNEERGIYITTGAGIGTGILGYLQGKRRETLLNEERIRDQQTQQWILGQQRKASGMYDETYEEIAY